MTHTLTSSTRRPLTDGYDEIHNDADRSTFVDHLEAFLNDYRHIRLVVTSREAGFSLVAPSIARFCSRWRVAPLEEDAIKLLCAHWHSLMKGNSDDSLREAQDVAERLLENESLRRLAENPLLLTMLLVVKHGAGRLPPDRVSLYERAVEVLLDTWNIKGHEPLNLKEAVPQLAFVAFELMRKGAQTATESELIKLLEEARESVPQIRRYAKDAPDTFLKRVELRSSLLIEGGHQLEGSRAVPFYQFRHLTFQEYLASVAAVEGHYVGYKSDDTILTPLQPFLTADEWKEVVPMAAVRAKKQAEFLHQVWLQYAPMKWHRSLSIASTFARLMEFRKPLSYWRTKVGRLELLHDLEHGSDEAKTRTLLTLVSICWGQANGADIVRAISERSDVFEPHLFSEHPGIWDAAGWGWGLSRTILGNPEPPVSVLDRLLFIWLNGNDKWDIGPFALTKAMYCLKDWNCWKPILNENQKDFVRNIARKRLITEPDDTSPVLAALFIGILVRDIFFKAELSRLIGKARDLPFLNDEDFDRLRMGLQFVSR